METKIRVGGVGSLMRLYNVNLIVSDEADRPPHVELEVFSTESGSKGVVGFEHPGDLQQCIYDLVAAWILLTAEKNNSCCPEDLRDRLTDTILSEIREAVKGNKKLLSIKEVLSNGKGDGDNRACQVPCEQVD